MDDPACPGLPWVPQGRLKIGRDAILDNLQPSCGTKIRKSWFSHTLYRDCFHIQALERQVDRIATRRQSPMLNTPSDREYLARSQFNPLILQLQNQNTLYT